MAQDVENPQPVAIGGNARPGFRRQQGVEVGEIASIGFIAAEREKVAIPEIVHRAVQVGRDPVQVHPDTVDIRLRGIEPLQIAGPGLFQAPLLAQNAGIDITVIEIVDFLFRREMELGMTVQDVEKPGRARFHRSDAQKQVPEKFMVAHELFP